MNVDWSFAPAPEGPEGEAAPAPQPPPPAPPPKRRGRVWRRLALLLGIVGAVALGAWLFTRLGWQRLQDQLAEQLVYEDQRAQAGDVGAALALQSVNPFWREQLAAQVRLGLAAPAPAGDLLPGAAPPRLARLDALGGDWFAAIVTRDYLDPAGQTVSFDLVQTYRNLVPGVWERQPPQTAALTATTLLMLQHLSATVPTADLPWLGPALLQADTLIDQACADWGRLCTPDLRMPVRFGVPAAQTSRWADLAPRALNLPRIFFADPTGPADVLPTPLLAGRPHDAAAQADYSRSIAAQLLGLYAAQLASGPDAGRGSNDYFLDALVARAEARHLGAAASPATLAPHEYTPIDQLWSQSGAFRSLDNWHTDLAWRREAFDFLNWELAGQSPAAEGRLLGALRQPVGPGVEDWLAAGLGAAGVKPASQWTAFTAAGFAAQPVTDWRPYEGLVLACEDGLRQMRDGVWHMVIPGPLQSNLASVRVGDISPDGTEIWLDRTLTGDTSTVSATSTSLEYIQLSDGALVGSSRTSGTDTLQVLGWTADNRLIFGLADGSANPSTPAGALSLRSGPPGSGPVPLIPQRVYANGPGAWSADHSALLVLLADLASSPTPVWALLTFSPTVALRTLPDLGDYAALSPSGDRVAFIKYSGTTQAVNTMLDGLDWLDVLDVATGQVTGLRATNDASLPPGVARFATPLWSPDGQTLTWTAYGPQGTASYLLTVPAAGGPLRVWPGNTSSRPYPNSFSPDGAYLLADDSSQPGPAAFWVFDQHAPTVAPPLAGVASAARWLPGGHRLVLATPAGVSSLDPGSGRWAWLGGWANCEVRG